MEAVDTKATPDATQATASEIVADVANAVLHADARAITFSGPVTINVYNYGGDCGDDDGEDLGSQDTDDDEDDDNYIAEDEEEDDNDDAEAQVPLVRMTNNGKRMPNDVGVIATAGRTPPAPAAAAYKVPVARKQQRRQ